MNEEDNQPNSGLPKDQDSMPASTPDLSTNTPNPSGDDGNLSQVQPNKYEGPVAQTNYVHSEYSESYNSNLQEVPKTHPRRTQWIILAVVLLLIAIVAAYVLLSSDSGDSTQQDSSQSAPESEDDAQASQLPADEEEEESNEITEEPTDAPSEPTATPADNDAERKGDINSVYQQLETFFAENAYYPSVVEATALGISDNEQTIDPDGNSFKSLTPRLSSTPADNPYTATKPAGAQYSYSPFKCNSGVAGEAKCSSFTIYTWLETEANGYTKPSLN